ncbi:hypothetical protein B0T10DRAFT_565644 [Thelonectria olida]|uniref:Uncharacterized protein n=1 Tax=Thelonectria olida TaxID=1576542 RepID=A0A9P8VVA6_9HYPO|nr:hypothetical protein B0T10DRAFT_565644 [Thelonectria olida]
MVITLPITFFPFITGLFQGYKMAGYVMKNRHSVIKNFEKNYATARQMNLFSVPGAPGIYDVAYKPYHVKELFEPTIWWQKLGLERFDIWESRYPPFGVADVSQLACLDCLYRELGSAEEEKSWHHWVYASKHFMSRENFFFDGWDEAFYRLVQHHNAKPSVANASFHWLFCPSSFLCNAWMVEGPALLHFTTEQLELDGNGELNDCDPSWDDHKYEKVHVQIIEFPITDPLKLALPRDTFPSYFNQMVGITGNTSMWKKHDAHFDLLQLARRAEAFSHEWVKEYPLTYGRLTKYEDAWLRMLGFEDSDLASIGSLCGSTITFLGRCGASRVKHMVGGFLERPKEAAEEEIPYDEDVGEDNAMAHLLRDLHYAFIL